MPAPIELAFLWHMHQPSYRHPETGAPLLPWVRLHTCRSYHDMAWLLHRHPTIKATFNFVPVLLTQLEALLAGTTDRYAELTLKPADQLDADDRRFLAHQFFSVAHATEVKPRPRYHALLQRRATDPDGARFSVAELRDLQLLFNLAWMGFGARAEFPALAALEARGRDFTEAHKAELLHIQTQVVARTLPLYRALVERQQIELSTTPAGHPILPLIIDSEHAARCQPHRPRPPRFAWPEDAAAHVSRAVAVHTRVFGAAPEGAWPAEGSVSPEAVQVLAEGGLRWLASDEAQLFGSLPPARPGAAPGDPTGHPAGDPTGHHRLYQPFRVWGGGLGGTAPSPAHAVDFVFRDRTLSDHLGFTYARNPAPAAVADLLARVRRARSPRPGAPALVVVALDGENPWEHYPESGRTFLETLYTALAAAPDITTVRVADHLRAHPPTTVLRQLKTGSWINGDFGIWMGGAMENEAWGLLGDARRRFAERAPERRRQHPEAVEEAYDHLLDAESSDWFWWYGEPFSSDNDRDFDGLFRGHLRQVYRLLGEPVPPALNRSLYPPETLGEAQQPRGRITPRLDGRSTWFDWLGAGVLTLGAGGSMYRATRWFERLRFGFTPDALALRLESPRPDAADPEARGPDTGAPQAADPEASPATHGAPLSLRVEYTDDAGRSGQCEVPLPEDPRHHGRGRPLPVPQGPPGARAALAAGGIELTLPFSALGVAPGGRLQIRLSLHAGPVALDHQPAEGPLEITLPGPDFDARNWTI